MIDPNNLAATAHVTFDDEFNTLSLWNGQSGTWDTGFQYTSPTSNGGTLSGNGEQEWYINSNYGPTASVKPWSVSNGVLDITAAPASSSISSLINGYKYTSGQINTSKSFSQTYGYFEMKAQLPAGQGMWPAFWLMPENGTWPPELDAMEVLGNDPTKLYTTAHYGSNNSQNQGSAIVADMSQGYHTYGVDWEPDYTTWYFDGKQVYKAATPSDMNSPMYMIANLAVGGYWPGNVNSSTQFPATMKVDYIRAYQSGAGAQAGGSSTGSGASTGGSSSSGSSSSGSSSSGSTGGSSSQTVGSATSTSAQTLTAPNDNGTHLVGGLANDILIASHGADTLTGGAGKDTFKFGVIPNSAGHVTDFAPGVDKLDLSALFQQAGYHGKYPGADGYLNLTSDGHGGTDVWFNPTGNASAGHDLITDLDGVAPTSINVARDINFGQAGGASTGSSSGSGSTSGSSSGSTSSSSHTITAPNDSGTHLTGGAGNDTLVASHGADTLTGGGGVDTFKFPAIPWSAGHITDFTPGQDVIDLRPLFQTAGYHGTNPVLDGYLSFSSDGHGDTQVYFNPHNGSNNGNPFLVTTLDHVQPSQITAHDWLFH